MTTVLVTVERDGEVIYSADHIVMECIASSACLDLDIETLAVGDVARAYSGGTLLSVRRYIGDGTWEVG